MPYEKELDKCLFSKTWEALNTKLTVSVMCYNGGVKKIQISRMARNIHEQNNAEFKFAKLGRLTQEEFDNILPIMQQARDLLST